MMINDDDDVLHRVVVVSAQSLCGRPATAAHSSTTVTVMATRTAFTPCQSAVPRRTDTCLGTQRPVPQHSPQPTAVDRSTSDRL